MSDTMLASEPVPEPVPKPVPGCTGPRVAAALLLIALAGVASPAAAATLDGVRLHQAPDHVRVVFDTSSSVRYELFTLSNPHRVVIDLVDTRPRSGFDAERVSVERSWIERIRTGKHADRTYRVVLDVGESLDPDVFTLAPVAPYGHRLVVDLYRRGAEEPARAPAGDDRDIVVVIDPGHGGEDPGAIGPGNVWESHVVLAISKQLERLLDRATGFEGVLTRESDYYIPLRGRIEIARTQRADLFVSVHADAFKLPGVQGGSVYTLSDRGATSEMASWLAEKENRSDLIGGVGAVSLDDKNDLLAHVLLDLSMDAKLSASFAAAEAVLSAMDDVMRLHKHRVEQAAFVVLKAPDVPSLLVETGFLSNPEEARLLASGTHQKAVARAIFNGLTDYLARHPPAGTLIAASGYERDGREYVIERGDTLSDIAARYRVSASRLREVNGLAGDLIRVGQVLIIPAS